MPNSRNNARFSNIPITSSNPQLSGPSRDQMLHDLDGPLDMMSTGSMDRDPDFLCLEQVAFFAGQPLVGLKCVLQQHSTLQECCFCCSGFCCTVHCTAQEKACSRKAAHADWTAALQKGHLRSSSCLRSFLYSGHSLVGSQSSSPGG